MINRDEVKNYLNITVDTYDDQIDSTIITVLSKICTYCNNDFVTSKTSDISTYDYKNATLLDDTITCDYTLPLAIGDWIRIYKSDFSDNFYMVSSTSTGSFTVDTKRMLKSETNYIYITFVEWPEEFLDLVAQYINMSVVNTSNVKQEKFDEVSYTYHDKSITVDNFLSKNADILNQYRNLYRKSFVR